MKKINLSRVFKLKKRQFSGFSLVELLVTLIIVSLVMSAFAPVITKKIKSQGVTIGAGTVVVKDGEKEDELTPEQKEEKENSKDCENGPSELCCSKMGAKYIPPSVVNGIGNGLCFSQYNAGDDYIRLVNGKYYHPHYAQIEVKMLTKGETCDTGICCFKDISAGTTNSKYNNYPAAGRTLCMKQAGINICKNWAPPGSKKGSWRLPTANEMTLIAAEVAKETESAPNFVYSNAEGLQLCSVSASTAANTCPHQTNTCQGAYKDSNSINCVPAGIMTQGGRAQYENTLKINISNTHDYAVSVRCVTDAPQYSEYIDERKPEETEPASQADCPGSIFISSEHTGSKNLCMFKYNAGELDATTKEAEDFASKYGIQLLEGGKNCNLSGTGMCCWYNYTGGGSGNYNYSGENRIVCMKNAGKKLCENYSNKNRPGRWRLPTLDELASISKFVNAETSNSKFLSRYLESNGLQLCTSAGTAYGANVCAHDTVCNGAYADSSGIDCVPSRIMSETGSYQMDNGKLASANGNDYARSVRCVTDNVKEGAYTETRVAGENEPKKQADCPEETIFIDYKYTRTKNICMFKYNAGEFNTITYEFDDFASKYGIQIIPGGKSCNLNSTGMCCWYNNTGVKASSEPYLYSGANRVVCMKNAGKTFCNNYSKRKGRWRLPTELELQNISTYITASGPVSPFLSKYVPDEKDGLQLCDSASVDYGANKCGHKTNTCQGAFKDEGSINCVPSAIMSEGKRFQMGNGVLSISNTNDYAIGVRCVADDMRQREEEGSITVEGEPEGQEHCGDDAVFIHKKYTGTTNLCMLKYNAGDENTVDNHANILDGITVVNGGTSCSGKCCWRQYTGVGASAEYYEYSGVHRTLCNKNAGIDICNNIGWRLPTEEEMKQIAKYVTASSEVSPLLSKYLNYKSITSEEGLRLCDSDSANYGANKCGHKTNTCQGAYRDEGSINCVPAAIMSEGKRFQMGNGVLSISNNNDYAIGVRCVTDKKQ